MMNANEEKLQREIELGVSPQESGGDVQAYKTVFRALGKSPEYQLPASFADKVIQKVIEKRNAKENAFDLVWFGMGVFFLLILLIITIAFSVMYFEFRPDLSFLAPLQKYKGLLITAVILIIVFNRIESKLIFRKSHS